MASAARDAGADVTIVSGPVSIDPPAGIKMINVESAEEMCAAALANVGNTDIFIAAAAVADYRPAEAKKDKIKKSEDVMTLTLIKAPDTLATIAALDNAPFCVGFAAETTRVAEYALAKLERKKLDMIIANKVGKDLGFDSDENAVEVFWKEGRRRFPAAEKGALAAELLELIGGHFGARVDSDVAAGH